MKSESKADAVAELRAKLEAEKARSAQLRERIAQTLHDTVCQSLNGANLEAAVLSQEIERKGLEGGPDAKVLREMLGQAVRELNEIVRSLREEA